MPGLGGLQVVKHIKEIQPDLQVILLTGHASKQDEHLGMQLGCYEYLIKPVDIRDLIDILNKACGQESQTKECEES
jgi:YesN/AraC family two-component response regulator